ncbi:hypothetical protein [Chitinophaga vietnamensis]|uniref:hypothetical protein n=1 Tax=Chitinophaga vietnamensis TaxID=2593957 RepID=UPI0013762187|nr:hypothetical protein [Chitinophaga vietnamensis]
MKTAHTSAVQAQQPVLIGHLLQHVNWLALEEKETPAKVIPMPAAPPAPVTPTLPPAAAKNAHHSTHRKDVNKKIRQCVKSLGHYYDLYLGYLELELEDAAARQEADLADDTKFSLAYYAWQLQQSA